MPRRNDLWSFLSLGSLSLEMKVCTFLPFLLTFHLPNAPHETFVSHPVFLSQTRFAPPSGALRRPFYQASLAYVTDVCELLNYAVMNQPSVSTNSSFDLSPVILLVHWLRVRDWEQAMETSCEAKAPEPQGTISHPILQPNGQQVTLIIWEETHPSYLLLLMALFSGYPLAESILLYISQMYFPVWYAQELCPVFASNSSQSLIKKKYQKII